MTDIFDINQIQTIIDKGIPHSAEIGIKVAEMSPDGVTFYLPYQKRFAGNPVNGVLHGGIITTLIDSTMGMSIYARLEKYLPIATLDLRIDYLKPATPGEDVYTRAVCYKTTRQIAFVRAIAYHSDRHDPIANAVATFMLKSTDTPSLGERLGVTQ
ncbi:PaaI family thioesterase [Sneathiella sp.]|uniref:PaaI family thioesterase n=1 Tax=Sneathiella sp. TaxID=1964365 RepID=UPI002FDF3FBA